MTYYFSKTLKLSFGEAIGRVTQALAREGFGVLTEIDIAATMKKKLDVDFRPYKILGACNPEFAHQALLIEDKVGTMLPCNVIVQQLENGEVEIAAVDPIASMSAVNNQALGAIAKDVQAKLKAVIESL